MAEDSTAELRAYAQTVATGNDAERIPGAVDFLDSLDEIGRIQAAEQNSRRLEYAADHLLSWLGSPSEFAAKTGDEWAPVILEVLKALDEAAR